MGRSDRDRVGADTHKASMAEADLTGETHQQVEAEAAIAKIKTRAATR